MKRLLALLLLGAYVSGCAGFIDALGPDDDEADDKIVAVSDAAVLDVAYMVLRPLGIGALRLEDGSMMEPVLPSWVPRTFTRVTVPGVPAWMPECMVQTAHENKWESRSLTEDYSGCGAAMRGEILRTYNTVGQNFGSSAIFQGYAEGEEGADGYLFIEEEEGGYGTAHSSWSSYPDDSDERGLKITVGLEARLTGTIAGKIRYLDLHGISSDPSFMTTESLVLNSRHKGFMGGTTAVELSFNELTYEASCASGPVSGTFSLWIGGDSRWIEFTGCDNARIVEGSTGRAWAVSTEDIAAHLAPGPEGTGIGIAMKFAGAEQMQFGNWKYAMNGWQDWIAMRPGENGVHRFYNYSRDGGLDGMQDFPEPGDTEHYGEGTFVVDGDQVYATWTYQAIWKYDSANPGGYLYREDLTPDDLNYQVKDPNSGDTLVLGAPYLLTPEWPPEAYGW